ncbi:MAG: 2-dehydropantoate 2-reductase [Calditrichaeota bacterium]|nr:2-dehydropantoate 2-reductase [Calditrichota bacterium]
MSRIYIIGAGAIGRVLAVLLAEAGRDVVLIQNRAEQPFQRKETITLRVNDTQIISADIELTALANHQQLDGIIAICTKSFTNADLANQLKAKSGDSPLILMQNGLGVENAFIDAKFPELYRAVLFVTSQFNDAGEVSFKPVSTSPLGAIKISSSDVEAIVSQISTDIFPFAVSADIQTVIWTKAIINSVFNSICPLLEIDNGIFHRNSDAFSLGRQLIGECVALAHEYDIDLDANAIGERVLTISRMSDGQLISTLQDINAGRPTEIETLNLAMAALAGAKGKSEVTRQTEILGELVQLKSMKD